MDIQEILKLGKVNIIDVREGFEYAQDHIDGAVNFPLSSFNDYLDDIKQMQGPKVLYCRSGARSGSAVQYLSGMGMEDVVNGGSLVMMKNYLIPA